MPEILQYNHCFMYFPRCLCKLMASKTRILVTNKIEHLKRADKILLLHNGESFFYGTFSELQSKRPDFSSLLLGLEAYDNVSAERRCSILTETLHRVSVDESAGMRPERSAFRQVAPSMPVYIDERKSSVIVNTLGAARKASLIQIPEEEVRKTLPDRKFSLVPENWASGWVLYGKRRVSKPRSAYGWSEKAVGVSFHDQCTRPGPSWPPSVIFPQKAVCRASERTGIWAGHLYSPPVRQHIWHHRGPRRREHWGVENYCTHCNVLLYISGLKLNSWRATALTAASMFLVILKSLISWIRMCLIRD